MTLEQIAVTIEKFNSLLKEYNDIVSNSGKDIVDLRENDYSFDILESDLFREGCNLRMHLNLANDLFDKIKLNNPNFKSDKLLEYNKFYVSNKLNMGAPWPIKGD